MSLLEKVESLDQFSDPRIKYSWHGRLKESSPKEYEEIREVAEDWISGGKTKKKFQTLSSLHRFLSGDDENKLDPPAIRCSLSAFSRFVKFLERELGK